MSFKLQIRGRECFEPSTAAKHANPLIPTLPTLPTISGLAELADPFVLEDHETDPNEPFTEPPGYEGTGWRLAGAAGLSAPILARFRAASQALDRYLKNY